MTARDRGAFAYFCHWKGKVGPGARKAQKKRNKISQTNLQTTSKYVLFCSDLSACFSMMEKYPLPPCCYRVSVKALIFDETRTKVVMFKEHDGTRSFP